MASKNNTTSSQRLIAGLAAGGVESLITYPTEYVKTRQQLSSSSALRILVTTLHEPSGLSQLYRGAPTFAISNSLKSGVRFFSFDLFRSFLPHNAVTKKPTPVANLIAGLGAGVAESVLVLTPGEAIKTKLIDDSSRAAKSRSPPRFNNAWGAIKHVLRTEGPRGLYRGVVPVSLKQASNAMVRFTTYNYFVELYRAHASDRFVGIASAVAGAGAGIVTVYCTMPMDTIKTRMQSLQGPKGGTLNCLLRIVREAGIKGLWKGTTPRLVRLSVSGAISFSVYESVVEWTGKLRRDSEEKQIIA